MRGFSGRGVSNKKIKRSPVHDTVKRVKTQKALRNTAFINFKLDRKNARNYDAARPELRRFGERKLTRQ